MGAGFYRCCIVPSRACRPRDVHRQPLPGVRFAVLGLGLDAARLGATAWQPDVLQRPQLGARAALGELAAGRAVVRRASRCAPPVHLHGQPPEHVRHPAAARDAAGADALHGQAQPVQDPDLRLGTGRGRLHPGRPAGPLERPRHLRDRGRAPRGRQFAAALPRGDAVPRWRAPAFSARRVPAGAEERVADRAGGDLAGRGRSSPRATGRSGPARSTVRYGRADPDRRPSRCATSASSSPRCAAPWPSSPGSPRVRPLPAPLR